MFDDDALHQRGIALEDLFFKRVDAELTAKLRQGMQREEQKKQLAATVGIQDDALLNHLLDGGFGPATIAALALVPAVSIAWADGSVTPEERQAVLQGASSRGVSADPTAFAMLEGWLRERPPHSLWELWKEYFGAVSRSLPPAVSESLKEEVLRLATSVVAASRRSHGFGPVSDAEQRVLEEIRLAAT